MGAEGRTERVLWARCFIGVLCVLLIHTFSNRYLNPLFASVGAAPAGRLVASAGALLFFLLLLLLAFYRPAAISVPRISALAGIAYVVGTAGMVAGHALGSPVLFSTGGFLANFGCAWVRVFALISLIELTGDACLSCVCLAMVVFYVVKAAVYALPETVGTVTLALLVPVAFAAAYPAATVTIARSRPSAAPAELALTEPRTFISLSHAFFITLIAFNVACGFSVSFGSVDGVPYSSLWAMAPVIAVALWLIASGKPHTDTVYVIACLFIVAGLLLILNDALARSQVPNTLLASGINIFKMVLIFTLAAIGRRNALNALPVFAWGEFATSLGIWIGDAAGTGVELAWTADMASGQLMVSALILGFVAYNLFSLRTFGFEKTVGSIEEFREVRPVVAANAVAQGAGVALRCEQIARQYGLTEREADVFGYLARGRNVPFIEEELVISRNTIKTHIRHIYQKMELHSQQELIDLVEGGA